MVKMNQAERAYEKHGTAATASAVSAFLSWYIDRAEEIERLTGELHKPYETHVTVKEILEEGLKELQGAADYFAHAEGGSEKDALWEGEQ